MIFSNCLAFTLRWEGGYSNVKGDRGGATNKGITQRTYDGWRHDQALPLVDVKHITDPEVEEIYKARYWAPIYGGNLPPQIALAVFDGAVNSGTAQAAKWLQRALGVADDGIIGPQTLAALTGTNPATVALKVCDLREQFLRNLAAKPGQQQFLTGWMRRVLALRQAILEVK